MNSNNIKLLNELFKNITSGHLKIVFDKWPDGYDSYLDYALNQKRLRNYDVSLANYLFVVKSHGILTTELGRSICKVLTCMQEYYFSLALLGKLASVKWTTIVKAPEEFYKIDPNLAKKFEREMPTTCAVDFYQLRDALKLAARGNYDEVKELSKSKSGNETTYQVCKSDAEIKEQAIAALDLFSINY